MRKEKTVKKKTAGKEKAVPKSPPYKRSQEVNKTHRSKMGTPKESCSEHESASPKKAICFNPECKLRRAGCYGYEACPGFKTKG